MFILDVHLLPSLMHPLVFAQTSAKLLKELDVIVRRYIRRWLRLPHDTPKAFFHAEVKAGGLGIGILQFRIPILRRTRLERLFTSSDPVIQHIVKHSRAFLARARGLAAVRRVGADFLRNKEDLKRVMNRQLHESVDGRGLSQHDLVPSVHTWVRSGTKLLTGGGYVHAVQVRGNLLHTSMRASRGRGVNESGGCEACGRRETLAHILQVCPKTSSERNTRHDRLVQYVAATARRKKWEVVVEPIVQVPGGRNRCPDLIITRKGQLGAAVDVTVAADNFNLSRVHADKVVYYDSPAVRSHVARIAEVPDHSVVISSVSLNWRGALSRESDSFLTTLGFSKSEKEVLSVRALEGAYAIYGAHKRGTWRSGNRRPVHQ